MKNKKSKKDGFGNFKEAMKKISKGKWDFFKLTLDYFFCRWRFHVNLNEYVKYELYNLKNRYRKDFLLVYHQKNRYINITTRHFTRSKFISYKRLPDLFVREIILLPHCGEDEFVEFMKKHQKAVLKPDRGSLGIGIEIFEYVDDESVRAKFKTFSEKKPVVCEEFIRQHHALDELNPFSVNTVRVVTILNEGEVEVVAAILKTGGTSYKFVDNMHNGGVGGQLDIETGIVTTFGRNYLNREYVFHPVTNAQIIGFRVPNWDKVIALAKEAHQRQPQCLIFGWDIAITEDGAEIVEVNNAPGPLLMQTMDRVPKGRKIIKMMKKTKIPQQYSKKDVYKPDYEKYL